MKQQKWRGDRIGPWGKEMKDLAHAGSMARSSIQLQVRILVTGRLARLMISKGAGHSKSTGPPRRALPIPEPDLARPFLALGLLR
ncbi:hypothetical protein [Bradyrhizobium iriomotense]|uniref:hypothetical protein n=1 Tax=Bradyrhizobium iriomotense TaxID=441950 RepID=UPI001B8A46C5|nr:hypothetical protein [Bradyrhizobium iriomotense]MBR0783855.1 hypothetical protein [Bradyrhizobium iriomotense]